jgi:hypothetical protein
LVDEVRSFLSPPFSYPVDLQNEVGRTALMYACFEGYASMVKMLVGEFHADVVMGTDMGGTAIQALILLKKRSLDSALSAAAEEILEYFVKTGVHFSAQSLAELGDLSRLKKCSSLALDSLQDTAGVVTRGSLSGSKVTGRGSDVGAVTAATDAGNQIGFLIVYFAADLTLLLFKGEGVVHIAARTGRVDILEHCALRGVNMGRSNYAGLNALHIACSYGNTAAALYLGKHIDVNSLYRGKSNALKLALEGKHIDTARSLKARYPHVKIPDIWCAVMLRDKQTILSMIQLGTTEERPQTKPVECKTPPFPPAPTAPPVPAPKKRLSSSLLSHALTSHVVSAPPQPTPSPSPPPGSVPQASQASQSKPFEQVSHSTQQALVSEAMFHGCKAGWTELVRLLLRRYGAASAWERVSAAIYGVLRPVDICVEEDNVQLLKMILNASRNLTIKGLNATNAWGSSDSYGSGSASSHILSPLKHESEEHEIRYHPIIRYLVNTLDNFAGSVGALASPTPDISAPKVATVSPTMQQYCLLLRALRKRHYLIAAILIKCGSDVNLICSGKYLVHYLFQAGLDYVEQCADTSYMNARNIRTGRNAGFRSPPSHGANFSGTSPEDSGESKSTMKKEMFKRLDRRSETKSPAISDAVTEGSPRTRSRNVLENAAPTGSKSDKMRGNFAMTAEGHNEEWGVGEDEVERDSDDDTDYGEEDDGGEGDEMEDDELWPGLEEDAEDEGGAEEESSVHNTGQRDKDVMSPDQSESLSSPDPVQHLLVRMIQTLNLMIEHGADMYCRDNLGSTCMHYASRFDPVYTRNGRAKSDSVSDHGPGTSENVAIYEINKVCNRNEVASIILAALFNARNYAGKVPW